MKFLGYLFVLAGFGGLVLSIEKLREKVTFIPDIDKFYFIIGGVVLILLGILILKFSPRGIRKGREVPIYQGSTIVGYRRS